MLFLNMFKLNRNFVFVLLLIALLVSGIFLMNSSSRFTFNDFNDGSKQVSYYKLPFSAILLITVIMLVVFYLLSCCKSCKTKSKKRK